jgi:ABC-2 type transport system ATP-binding protein
MTSEYIIQTNGLSYQYPRQQQTLSDINILVEKASVYGFLGPNGCGKTTTLSLLLGLLKLQQGSIRIFGQEFRNNRIEILKRTGSLIENPSLYGHMTAKENLEIYRKIYGASKERADEVLTIVGLHDTKEKIVRKFSLGMKQRLAIALALLPKPELLILDEPTNGLDPNGIIELRQLIRKLNKIHGMTILISSHILAEVEKMVTHIGIIARGRMLFQGTPDELQLLQKNQKKVQIHTSDNEMAMRVLRDYQPERERQQLIVPYHDISEVSTMNKLMTHHNLDVYLLQPKEQQLEQLYIDLTSNHS